MKILLFLVMTVITVLVAVSGNAQVSYGTTYTTKEFKRAANMPIRQSELPDAQAKHFRSSSSLKHYSVQQTGDEQCITRYVGYNGGKDTVVVTTIRQNYSYSGTNQTYYVPQMVQATTTAKAGTVCGPSKSTLKSLLSMPFKKR